MYNTSVHKRTRTTNKDKVTKLLKSTKPWTLPERALVISDKGENATFTRKTIGNRCVSCNKEGCLPGTCAIGSSYKRWAAKTGKPAANQQSAPRRDYQRDHKKADKQRPCYDYQKGRCQRGDACRYSHDSAESSTTTDNGSSSDSELARLRKANAVLTKGTHDLTQLLCQTDPAFAQSAHQAVGESLKKRSMAFILSQNTDDH